MKNALFLFVSLFLVANSNAQLSGIVSEVYYDPAIDGEVPNYPEGFRTYRIYAELENPTDFVSAVYALGGCHTLFLVTEGILWNSPAGALTGDVINPGLFAFMPEVQYDSFVTIGRANNSDPGGAVLTAIAEECPDPNIIWGNDPVDGGGLHLCDGAIFTNFGNINGLPVGDNNRVLLFQITTNQNFYYCLNLQVFIEGDPDQEVLYVWDDSQVGCNSPLEVDGSSLGLCTYTVGCTDPEACNYNPYASEDDGSCHPFLDTVVEGIAFFDLNGNGIFDGGEFGESTLFNRQILVHETGEILFTGPFGEFQFVVPAGETYHISLLDTDDIYDPAPGAIELPVSSVCDGSLQGLNLPAIDESGLEALLGGPLDIYVFHCEDGVNAGLWISNTGATTLNGVITLEFSNTLSAEPFEGPLVVAPDILIPGMATWNFEDQLPGEQFLYQCHIAGPGVDFIGTLYSFTITLVLIDENEEQVFFNSWTIEEELVCSYDPNDKAAVPQGYAEPHFILPNDEIDYRIRFQNTGNYPAETVVLVDTLDIQSLDIATFQPVVGSHPYTCNLQDDGTLTFRFDDIWLPDVESNEPESHGFISFRIRPIGGIEPNEVINNTAYIYFDSNPPIITNTTWHTIFDCSELELLGEPLPVCEGEALFVEVDYPYAEDFSWYINGEPEGDNLPGFFLDSPVSDMSLTLEASNPLCSGVSSSDIVVVENPTAEITQEGNVLSATPGMDSYQWFFNGSMIPGADQQTYAITASGEYSVAITDGNGCSSMSLPSIVVGIEAVQGTAVTLFPNPMEHSALLQFARADAGRQIRVTDLLGKQVMAWQNAPGMQFEIQRGSLRSGLYLIHVSGAGSSETMRLMIQ